MSKIKFNPNLFLGVQEWNIFQSNINNAAKRNLLLNTDSYGIVRQINLPEIGNINLASSFYVSKAGTPYDEVIIGEGVAIDKEGNFIINPEKRNIKIPADSNWYSIVISYNPTNRELGKVSVDSNGVLTGIGTQFTKTLRGFGEFNSKIRFLDTKYGNSREYEVARVIDDSTAVLIGDFIAEINMEYGVFGTFLDGYQVPANDSMIFEYDFFKFELFPSDEVSLKENEEFVICNVNNNGIDVTIEDARTNWWQSEAMSALTNINKTLLNKTLGIEEVKWDVLSSPKDENLIKLSWVFTCTNFTIDTNSKKISLLIGKGGIFKDTSYFTSGDFNGWRVYSPNGNFVTIIDSQKSGTQIVLTTDILIPSDFEGYTDLNICPPFEAIEFRAKGEVGESNEKIQSLHKFNINSAAGYIRLKVTEAETFYNLSYRYKIFNGYTNWKNFPEDSVGYYDESSFDEFGVLNSEMVDRTLVPYSSTQNYFLKLKEHPESYKKTIFKLDSGDLLGVNKTAFKNETPLVHLFVGKDKKYQHFSGEANTVLNLQADITYILNSKKDDGSELRDGNCFFIHVTQNINLNNFKIKFVQDYVNATTSVLLAELKDNDIAYIKNNLNRIGNPLNNGIFIQATWSADFQKWLLTYETDQTPKGTLRQLSTAAFPLGVTQYFNQGVGILAPYFGWKLAEEYDEKFLRVDNEGSFATGGSDSITLTEENLPEHDHFIFANEGGNNGSPSVNNGTYAKASNSTNGNMGYGIESSNTEANVSKTSKSGTETPESFDNKPSFKNLILIEKIV